MRMSKRPSARSLRTPTGHPPRRDLGAGGPPVALGPGTRLEIDGVARVARGGAEVRISQAAIAAMKDSRRVIDKCLSDGDAHYGVNTGFGALAKQRISMGDLADLQCNLVRSHAAGVCEALDIGTTRAMMLCLAASLARGLSGVRPEVVALLVGMLNAGVVPVVPSVGSVGASGDLAPLSAVALAMIGEGTCRVVGGRGGVRGNGVLPVMSSSVALRKAGLKPISLAAKEGLALINGTHLMAGSGALLVHDARHLLHAATVGLAMSIDACRASHGFLDARLYAARKQVGPGEVAGVLRGLLAGSLIVKSHVANDPRVQDPYSLRAGPMVLGAVRDALAGVAGAISQELQAVTDNPLILGGVVRSGANFHGMPVAIPLDTLAIALCHIAGVSERRSFLMTGAFEPESHLKPFLAPQPGLQSGLMVAQYAAAACVNEMIGLATPASVANIPTCAGMEDYNSFGPRSAAKAGRGIELARRVVAIEMVIAAAGLDIHRPLLSGRGVEGAHKLVRRYARPMGADRSLTGEIEALAGAIGRGEFAEIGA